MHINYIQALENNNAQYFAFLGQLCLRPFRFSRISVPNDEAVINVCAPQIVTYPGADLINYIAAGHPVIEK